VGGEGEDGENISAVELYDPQAASWTQRAGMAGPRAEHGCFALDGKLYAGYGAYYEALDTAEVYDPQTDGWQPMATFGQDEHCAWCIGASRGRWQGLCDRLMEWRLGTELGRGLRPAARRLGSGGEHVMS
jgi:hypothetical protein